MNLKALKVRGRFGWGYSIKSLEVSKDQTPLSIPPPTTLIGALANSFFRVIGKETGEVVTETIDRYEYIGSPVAKFSRYFKVAAITMEDSRGIPYKDINRYVTLHFHRTSKNRRYQPEYMMGAILNGRVYCPGCKFTVIYIFDISKLREEYGSGIDKYLLIAGWEIDRIGSKESIVEILNSKLLDVRVINNTQVTTRYYFPYRSFEKIVSRASPHFTEHFWNGGYLRLMRKSKGRSSAQGVDVEVEVYLIPGTPYPVSSSNITIELSREGIAYEAYDGGEKHTLVGLRR